SDGELEDCPKFDRTAAATPSGPIGAAAAAAPLERDEQIAINQSARRAGIGVPGEAIGGRRALGATSPESPAGRAAYSQREPTGERIDFTPLIARAPSGSLAIEAVVEGIAVGIVVADAPREAAGAAGIGLGSREHIEVQRADARRVDCAVDMHCGPRQDRHRI